MPNSATDLIGRGERLPKWQNFILTLAENGRQKIFIYRKKAIPLQRNSKEILNITDNQQLNILHTCN